MPYIFSGHFTGMFFYLCVAHYGPSFSSNSAYATSSNSSEEIKNIFSLPEANASVLKGTPKSGIFAEGGLINESLTKSSVGISDNNLTKSLNTFQNFCAPLSHTNRQNISFYSNSVENKNLNFFEVSTTKTLLPTKLSESNSNFLLEVPEVVHINETSYIKPCKGVHNKKIVPYKDVHNENKANHGFSHNRSCLWLSENECYNIKEIKGLKCSCCKESNSLGKAIKQQFPVNCKNCKSENILYLKSKQNCTNICCNSVFHGIYSVSATEGIQKNYLNSQVFQSSKEIQKNLSISQITNDFKKSTTTKVKNLFLSSKKNSKLKPSVTKVPYDEEVVTELLSKDQQKVFIPVVVSLFLLPLIGILIFFLWQRTKEYWDKRYYKQMDFLIDGMYND